MQLLPNQKSAYRTQITRFGGLNVREGAADGELLSCKNLSTRNYPALSPCLMKTAVGSYQEPTGLFAWDKLVVVDKDKLLYDGVQVGTVSLGEKLFAVVNTKLCIFPDKKYIDITTGTCKNLEGEAALDNCSFSSNGMSGTVTGLQTIQQKLTNPHVINIGTGVWEFLVYSSVDTSTTPPTLSGEEWVEAQYIGSKNGKYVIPSGSKDTGYSFYYRMNFAGTSSKTYYGTPNTEGIYGMISYAHVVEDDDSYDCTIRATLYKSAPDDLSKLFSAGDVVNVSGSVIPSNNKKIKIKSVSEKAITFQENSFFHANLYAEVSTAMSAGGTYDFRNSDFSNDYYRAVIGSHPVGSLVFIGSNNFQVQDKNGVLLESGTVTVVSEYGNRVNASVCNVEKITVKRSVPDLDFICQSGNRLWGVSNKAENTLYDDDGKPYTYEGRCIYASALGDPTNFFDYSGLSTDSYAVGVASKGDFTAICSYSDNVLCWKESEMLRITGSYPAAYYLYSYTIPGVKKGCHKSIQVIDEILYYLSGAGVFSYSGSVPALLSYKLGDGPLSAGVSGADGRRYFLSVKNSSGTYDLFTYDTVTKLWMREDGTQALDFCTLDETLYMLAGNYVMTVGTSNAEGLSWEAVLHPFYEDVLSRKYYRALLLRGELSNGSNISVFAKIGDKEEKNVLSLSGNGAFIRYIPLPLERADRIQVRITGVGDVKILDMQRKYSVGSDI